jgi:polyribonucleotide nucleotidyltransferase
MPEVGERYLGTVVKTVDFGAFDRRCGNAAGFDHSNEKARLGPILGRMCERPRNRSGCKEKGQEEEDHPSH